MTTTSSIEQLQGWLQGAADIAMRAGDLILELYEEQAYEMYEKDDESPVTSADFAANRLIVDGLAALTPDIPVLSEEGSHLAFEERRKWPRYWMIDPIDGTQEFIARSGDFGVIIALVEYNQPVLGVIYWPAGDVLYTAQRGQGAFRRDVHGIQRIQVRRLADPLNDVLHLAISRRQPRERVLQRMTSDRELQLVPAGSCSLKACMIAEGRADCFLRVGPTGEWDTAAAEVIVGEAGGRIVSESFTPLTYNQEANLGNPNFIILGDPEVPWQHVFTHHRNAD
ncbi:3'(2'), 5'-bisphosphate nucleotidase [Pseudidiomarina maritima]|uniref:3'(2'),5'-bisphosphate nucleotidase CysQ n=1 Tax=Pseudidiomarina maritima TaxID=519453 RepID=A0A1I6HGJ3_9GAMM|nr:3'(2'),5'-bisphosphate nucleotidase CysQ [Pseudidiomarina maritima]SFR53430.1 3'(2'), 5'-bisphosphate nucleotidase [Pseudidiomarina maritima]